MRQLVVSNLVSVDGFFAGPQGELDWFVADEEFDRYALDQIRTFDTLFLGRVTYQLFEGYWPTAPLDPTISREDRAIAQVINEMEKIVFSRTLERVNWHNARLVREINRDEILDMKRRPGKDMVIYGSGSLVAAFARLGLIDEYRLIVNPVILGRGRTLFQGLSDRLALGLVDHKTFRSGNVQLVYRPA